MAAAVRMEEKEFSLYSIIQINQKTKLAFSYQQRNQYLLCTIADQQASELVSMSASLLGWHLPPVSISLLIVLCLTVVEGEHDKIIAELLILLLGA